MNINKTIIPAAGQGTRFLPYTKAIPKEMVLLVDKPAIQYTVQESVTANLDNIIVIANKDRQSMLNYFDSLTNTKISADSRRKQHHMDELNKLLRAAHFSYIQQSEPLGLGHAVLMAKHVVEPKEHVAIILPDDIIIDEQPTIGQLATIAHQERASVIAVQEVPYECLSEYGVIAIKKQITPRLYQVSSLVEKPVRYDAPSNLAVIGRYILSAKIFPILQEMHQHADHELQLTDAISKLIRSGEKVIAYKIQGMRYDIGTPIGWLKATISLAMQHPEYAQHIKEFLTADDMFDSFQFNPTKNILHKF